MIGSEYLQGRNKIDELSSSRGDDSYQLWLHLILNLYEYIAKILPDLLIRLLLDDLNEVLHDTAAPFVHKHGEGQVSQQVLSVDLCGGRLRVYKEMRERMKKITIQN